VINAFNGDALIVSLATILSLRLELFSYPCVDMNDAIGQVVPLPVHERLNATLMPAVLSTKCDKNPYQQSVTDPKCQPMKQ